MTNAETITDRLETISNRIASSLARGWDCTEDLTTMSCLLTVHTRVPQHDAWLTILRGHEAAANQ